MCGNHGAVPSSIERRRAEINGVRHPGGDRSTPLARQAEQPSEQYGSSPLNAVPQTSQAVRRAATARVLFIQGWRHGAALAALAAAASETPRPMTVAPQDLKSLVANRWSTK
jgi:hypothetical protein